MRAYYNENDPFCCAWLQKLMDAGHITPGKIDDRSIIDVRPDDLAGYERVHFFAGIGGWDHALNLAGWRSPVWTGSCPCQPLSSAGQQRGHADERHLWPAFHALIAQCKPATVFGEQVASKDGREWLAGIRADLEGTGYACGAADLCAAGAGAPHIRQRLYWVADSQGDGRREERADVGGLVAGDRAQGRPAGLVSGGAVGGLGDADGIGRRRQGEPQSDLEQNTGQFAQSGSRSRKTIGRDDPDRLGDADDTRPQGRGDGPGEGGCAGQLPAGPTGVAGFWDDYAVVPCRDNKERRTGPGIFPLAHGVSGRVGRLRGYGNAIVPQVAAEFIRAWMEAA